MSTILQHQTLNGNRGAQQELSVSTKVLKEILIFRLEFPT